MENHKVMKHITKLAMLFDDHGLRDFYRKHIG